MSVIKVFCTTVMLIVASCAGMLAQQPRTVTESYVLNGGTIPASGVDVVMRNGVHVWMSAPVRRSPGDAFGPIFDVGNSDARENYLQLSQDDPTIQAQVFSFYSNPCSSIQIMLPYLLNMYASLYGGLPPIAFLNWEGQCDMEKNHPISAVLTCEESIMQMENTAYPGTPQVWPNIAPEPQYSLGPPSSYSPMIWSLNISYNQAAQNGLGSIPGLPAYAAGLGASFMTVDAYDILRLGVWANPGYFNYPSVDPSGTGEQALDVSTTPAGLMTALSAVSDLR